MSRNARDDDVVAGCRGVDRGAGTQAGFHMGEMSRILILNALVFARRHVSVGLIDLEDQVRAVIHSVIAAAAGNAKSAKSARTDQHGSCQTKQK